ncbi:MAG TPA: hypothetical protein VF133_02775 [Terriglobales bacterium]
MTPYEEFWDWFVRHETELFDFEKDQKRIFDKLLAALRKVNQDLVFEFGLKKQEEGKERQEFVISADGIKSAFPAVISLRNTAPDLPRWQITAFRPRRTTINIVEIGDRRIDPKDVQFTLLSDGKNAGLYLFIPDFRENDDAFKQIGYLMLDEALGEFDVETRLGLIKMLTPEGHTHGERHPLPELPRLFDQLTVQLEGRSGKPS